MKKHLALLIASFAIFALSACDEGGSSSCDNGSKKCDQNSVSVCINNAWQVETPCVGGTFCDSKTISCQTPCTTGSKRCNNKSVELCDAGNWKVEATCLGTAVCNVNTHICEVPADICSIGTKRCNGKAIEACNGQTWQLETTCQGTALCNANSYTCDTPIGSCSNGTKRCNGQTVEVCSAETWQLETTCQGTAVCNASTYSCETPSTTCKPTDGTCSGNVYTGCNASQTAIETINCANYPATSFCLAQKGCVQCRSKADCKSDEFCNDFYKCDFAGTASTINWCKSEQINVTSKTGYGRVFDSRLPRNPSTIRAILHCGQAGQNLKDYQEFVGVQNTNCQGCGDNFEYQASINGLAAGDYLCLWSFSLLGEKAVACQTNGTVIVDLNTIPDVTVTLAYSQVWDHIIDFENFTINNAYNNTQTITVPPLTTSIVGAIQNSSDFSIEGNTLVFGNKNNSKVSITHSDSNAFVGQLSFEYKGFLEDNFGTSQEGRKFEIYLNSEINPIYTIDLRQKIETLQTVDIPINKKVKTISIKRYSNFVNNNHPRLLIDNIRWTNHM